MLIMQTDHAVDGDEAETISNELLTQNERERRRLERKPSIDHLKPGTAIVDGEVLPLFNVGDRIVVERSISFRLDHPWLDTRVYKVISIDDDSGVVRCFDDELMHNAYVGFKDPHSIVKLYPAKGNPLVGKKRRSLGKIEKMIRAQQVADGDAVEAPKRKRGRPAGVKNKPKEQAR